MDPLAFASSIILGFLTLAGVFVTNRRVGKVREENTSQHGAAQAERESSLLELQKAHEKILGKVELVHEDVQQVVGSVAVIHHRLIDHVTDIKAHGDAAWKTVTPEELHIP